MNFIAGNFVYHSDPEISFALFAALMGWIKANYDCELSGLHEKQS